MCCYVTMSAALTLVYHRTGDEIRLQASKSIQRTAPCALCSTRVLATQPRGSILCVVPHHCSHTGQGPKAVYEREKEVLNRMQAPRCRLLLPDLVFIQKDMQCRLWVRCLWA
mgnify:CR=1 FL=1